ncbi:MAG: hypothetical protein AB7F89_00320 [Pirellulaceae bacterium]
MGADTRLNSVCPDCGRPLQSVWDYPANELWCVRCGNRYFAAFPPAPLESSDPMTGFRLLLLDEDPDGRDVLARRLTQLGYLVTPVCHARQALEAASFRRFDLVVLPNCVAEFDCRALVGKLRQLLGNLRFVVVTRLPPRDESTQPGPVWEPDSQVVCAALQGADSRELERAVEEMADSLIAARERQGDADEIEQLLGTA